MKTTAVFLALIVLLSGCTSTTIIRSIPSGADVYINEEYYGTTPATYSDQKITTSTNYVRLELEGYEVLHTTFSRDEEVHVGAIIGGLFFWIPFLWTMQYKPGRTYELTPAFPDQLRMDPPAKTESKQSISDQLRELQALYQDGVITEEEFIKLKSKLIEQQ